MIVIVKDSEGEYDSYMEFNVAMYSIRKKRTQEQLEKEYSEFRLATISSDPEFRNNERTKKKLIKRHLKDMTFGKWLVKAYGAREIKGFVSVLPNESNYL